MEFKMSGAWKLTVQMDSQCVHAHTESWQWLWPICTLNCSSSRGWGRELFKEGIYLLVWVWIAVRKSICSTSGLSHFSVPNVIQLLYKDGGGEYTGRENVVSYWGKDVQFSVAWVPRFRRRGKPRSCSAAFGLAGATPPVGWNACEK